MDKVKVLSPAKINLDLIVENKRKDNFHNINSLIQPINFYDEIHIERSESAKLIDLDFPDKIVKYDDNLIVKAAQSFFKNFKVSGGIKISVKKRIPIGSGMGGGSSNAASTLIGLSKLFNIDRFSDLEKIGLELGSDVPFFLYSRTSRVSGRGEIIKPFNIDEQMKYLIILPGIESNTKKLFEMWDNKQVRVDCERKINFKPYLEKKTIINKNLFTMRNDFTPLLLMQNERYIEIFKTLKDLNIDSYSISGTGSTIFCVMNKNEDFKESQKYLESSNDLVTLNVEAFEGWHFTFD